MPVLNRARRLLLAAVLTAAVAALACASASAIRLSLNEPTFRAAWAPMRFIVAGFAISCNATLEGSFHSTTIAKVEQSLIGYVTRASSGSCSSGTMSVLTESLPWHVQYNGFTGSLPNILSMRTRVIGMSASLTFLGLTCLARSEVRTPAVMVAERNTGTGAITSFRWEESTVFPLTGSGSCTSISGRLGGTSSSPTGLGTARAITLTLIGEAPTLSPSPVEFGVVEAEGVTSRNVTIRAGSGSVIVNSIGMRSGASFARLDPNRCIGSTLTERSTCVFKVIFAAPRETGGTFEDTVSVNTNVATVTDVVRAST